jgi:phage protein U
MYARFGNIVFESLNAPEEFNLKKETVFYEHARVNRKPKLQRTGENLDDLKLVMHFHGNFCNPESEFEKLNSLRKNAKAELLVFGNGDIVGSFVVTSIEKTVNFSLPDGTIVDSTVNVNLKEYQSVSKKRDKEIEAKKNAFAVNPDIPRTMFSQKSITANPAALISVNIQEASLASAQSNAAIDEAAQNPGLLAKASAIVAKANEAIYISMEKANAVLSGSESLQQQTTGLGDAFTAVQNAAQNIISAMPITSISEARDAASQVNGGLRSVKILSAPISTISSFRGLF